MNYNPKKVGGALQNRLESGWQGKVRVKVYTNSSNTLTEDLTVDQVERFSWFNWITAVELESPILVGGVLPSSMLFSKHIFGTIQPVTTYESYRKSVRRKKR